MKTRCRHSFVFPMTLLMMCMTSLVVWKGLKPCCAKCSGAKKKPHKTITHLRNIFCEANRILIALYCCTYYLGIFIFCMQVHQTSSQEFVISGSALAIILRNVKARKLFCENFISIRCSETHWSGEDSLLRFTSLQISARKCPSKTVYSRISYLSSKIHLGRFSLVLPKEMSKKIANVLWDGFWGIVNNIAIILII